MKHKLNTDLAISEDLKLYYLIEFSNKDISYKVQIEVKKLLENELFRASIIQM